MKGIIRPACMLILTVIVTGCVQRLERKLTPPDRVRTLDGRSPFLKVHTLNGRVYVLSPWRVAPDEKAVSGPGEVLDADRAVAGRGEFTVPIDSVAVFETNVVHTSPSVAALAVVTGASLALTVYCAQNPKACFGSCPTFYVSDGERPTLQAEGFSSSIARALEATDVDALYRARVTGRDLEIGMKNEALETHNIRYVHLLAAPRPEGRRVFVTSDGIFYQTEATLEPRACAAPEGDCVSALRAFDGVERFSLTDSTDLATREIASRQTLVSTFLFYQTLAYMGRSAGQWFAEMERGNEMALENSRNILRALCGIEVFIQNSAGVWVSAGEMNETGPLATDMHLLPLPHLSPGISKVRLSLARGHWRLDYAALVKLGRRVEPLRLQPSVVHRNGVPDERARQLLLDPARILTTLPGDEYTLVYHLPEDSGRYELFLEGRGYYLEWMREAWLAEENPARAALMFFDPRGAFRAMAPEFKKVEAQMETSFWSSRYARP